MRRVAAADGSVGRIFDGHLNGVERLAVQGTAPLRDAELAAVAAGELLVGVWGGDPVARRGTARRAAPRSANAKSCAASRRSARVPVAWTAHSCSLAPATVARRSRSGSTSPIAAGCEIDESWYRSHGLVASVSHRVVFHDAPVLARLGEPGAIAAQPWFGRDALRTSASWAGMADTAVRGRAGLAGERVPGRADQASWRRSRRGASSPISARSTRGWPRPPRRWTTARRRRRRGAARARGHCRRLPRAAGRGRPGVRVASVRPRRGA